MFAPKTTAEIANQMRGSLGAQLGDAAYQPGTVLGDIIDTVAQHLGETHETLTITTDGHLVVKLPEGIVTNVDIADAVITRSEWEGMYKVPTSGIYEIIFSSYYGKFGSSIDHEPKTQCPCEWIRKVSDGYSCLNCDHSLAK